VATPSSSGEGGDSASGTPGCEAVRVGANGSSLTVNVWAVPGSARSCIEGVRDGYLRVRVTAGAHEGRANEALCGVLADRAGVPRSAVHLVQGARSRRKLVRIDSPSPQALIESLCASR
jgi:uncharacterized protein